MKDFKKFNFRLICKTRSRIHQALIGKSKSISKKVFGTDFDTHRKWIEEQLTTAAYGD